MDLYKLLLSVPAAAYLVDVIINSTILVHITNKLIPELLFTREDLKNWMMARSPAWLYDLLHCPKCLSFHCSWMVLTLSVDRTTAPVDFILTTLACAWASDRLYSLIHSEPPQPAATVPAEFYAMTDEEAKSTLKPMSFMGSHYRPETKDGVVVWELAGHDPRKDEILKFFEQDDWCKDPYCFGLRSAYEAELAALREAAVKDNKTCSTCGLNSIKNKYYKKVQKHLDASVNSEVS
jgi:hypothetical protein